MTDRAILTAAEELLAVVGESYVYVWNFTESMAAGDTIASAVISYKVGTSAMVTVGAAAANGTLIPADPPMGIMADIATAKAVEARLTMLAAGDVVLSCLATLVGGNGDFRTVEGVLAILA